jgi:hypothetical protein
MIALPRHTRASPSLIVPVLANVPAINVASSLVAGGKKLKQMA